MKPKPTLSNMLMLAFLPVAVFPMLFVALVAGVRYNQDRSAVETQIQEELIRTSHIRKRFVESVLGNTVDSLELIAATWPNLRPGADPNEILRGFTYRLLAVVRLSVASPEGRILYSSDPAYVGKRVSLRGDAGIPIAKRSATFTDLLDSRANRRYIHIFLPFSEKEVLVAAYDTDQLQDAFRQARGPRHHFTFLVDHQGHLITHSDDLHLTARRNLSHLPPVQKALQGYQGSMTYRDPDSGEELSAAYLSIPRSGWALILAQPSARSILSPAATTQRDNLLILFGAMLAASMATAVLSRRLAQPVERFSRKLECLSREEILPEQAEILTAEDTGVVEHERVVESAKALYKALAQTIVQLEARSNELRLANHEMEATVENLRRLDKLKADFLNALSHDLRIPLTAILGYAEMLQDLPSVSPEAQGYVEQILDGCNAMREMLEGLLDYARLEVGRLTLRLEPVDLGTSLEEVDTFFRPLAQQKNLLLSLEAPLDLPVLETDPDRLRQVLNNLLSNAIKYTPPGGSVILRALPNRDRVCIAVSDTGIGLSDEDKRHLFERFFRSNRPEVQQEKGSGLGLSLVKGTVEAMGGHLEVESQVGRGSTFRFCLATGEDGPPSPSSRAEVG